MNYEFDCGCKFPIIDNTLKAYDNMPSIDLDYDTIPLNCPATWALISSGETKGVFQLETDLGRSWAKRLQPCNIEELSALISLMRPGCLKAISDGKSMTQHYIDRKFGREEVQVLHDCLGPIMEDTYGVLTYQEQAIKIATAVAGFSPEEADILRKAIGKKKPEIMTKVEKQFMEGCARMGIVSTAQAAEIFGWIRESQKYSFNKCVAGTTKLLKHRGKMKTLLTVEEHYKIFNDVEYAKKTGHFELHKKWKANKNFSNGFSMAEDGRIYPNTIVDIRSVGLKPVIRITTETGKFIDVTKNHKFPVIRDGQKIEITADEIWKTDTLIICGEYESTLKNYAFSSITTETLHREQKTYNGCGFPDGINNPSYTNGSYSAFVEYRDSTPDICELCQKTTGRFEVHHKDGNRANSTRSNLQKLCVSCHKKEEYKAGRTKVYEKGYPTYCENIVSIEDIGIVECYDVEMAAPYHNFVIDNKIVTCNSHGVGYAYCGYWCAYVKQHFPLHFYCAWLSYADQKIDPELETADLIFDAKKHDIDIRRPSFKNLNFDIEPDGCRFGLTNIKGIGAAAANKVIKVVVETENKLHKNIKEWSWLEFLVNMFCLNKVAVNNMIYVGMLDHLGLSRKQMVYEYQVFSLLSPKERDGITKHYHLFPTLLECVEYILSAKLLQSTRVDIVQDLVKALKNPSYDLKDSIDFIIIKESELLSVPLTYSRLDKMVGGMANATCKEVNDGKTNATIAIEITAVREYVTKNGKSAGQKMAFVNGKDETYDISISVFADLYTKYKSLLTVGNIVVIYLKSNDKGHTATKILQA